MKLNWLDILGDWNPQLLRELKGRLKLSNVLIASAMSLIGQALILLAFGRQLPPPQMNKLLADSKYCTGSFIVGDYRDCIQDASHNLIINWQLWWVDLFVGLSTVGIFVLLVGGTYLLISDLANEERRGTLNFIRLSPRSLETIFIGKLLGVPILVYLIAALALPLHLLAGLKAQFSLIQLLCFYSVLIASCFFFYSGALLFSLVTPWLGGLQAWIGSGGVLTLLLLVCFRKLESSPTNWLSLFSPSLIIQQLASLTKLNVTSSFDSTHQAILLQGFFLPIGVRALGIASLQLMNYGVWTYWSWQALKRRFLYPNKTILSKQQSYLLSVCFAVVTMGFALLHRVYRHADTSPFHLYSVPTFNLILFLSLILVLTPGRQALQDWARYRRQKLSYRQGFWSRSLVRDLLWGEKSPALVAIAINVSIAYTILIPWAVLGFQEDDKLHIFLSWLISFNLTLIYAAITQLIMLMRTQKQELWVIGLLSALILLPQVILSLLSFYFDPVQIGGLRLFTPSAGYFFWSASLIKVFFVMLGQWGVLTLLTLQITRQLRRMGESESKALFKTAGSGSNLNALQK